MKLQLIEKSKKYPLHEGVPSIIKIKTISITKGVSAMKNYKNQNAMNGLTFVRATDVAKDTVLSIIRYLVRS